MNIQFFGLLHLEENEQSAMLISAKNFQDQISVYVNQAIVLSRSLQLRGLPFTLLTNNKALVEDYASLIPSANNVAPLQVREIPFTTKVPTGISYYSAHFKLDVFRYFASLSNDYLVLCDLDIVCINDYPICLSNIVKRGIPLCYDVTDQVISWVGGHDVIIRDLTTISGLESEGRWSGGEFISGTPDFFKNLIREIDSIYDNYVANLDSLYHIGDEPITSAALEILRSQGTYIGDAGTLGVIGRCWSIDVSHEEKPFDYYKKCFLLHLPADKKFLANLAYRDTDVLSDFIKIYEKHRDLSRVKNQVKKLFKQDKAGSIFFSNTNPSDN